MSLTEREQAWLIAANQLNTPYEDADIKQPYVKLGDDNPNYIWQDGWIYAWSESNIVYQHCWWLTPLGEPINPITPLVQSLLRDRPFDPDWLKAAVPS